MKRGVIASINDDLGRLESFSTTRHEEGVELQDTVEITGIQRTPNGLDITVGRAASDKLIDAESVSQSNGNISISTSPQTETRYTEFLIAGDSFIAIESSDGAFVLDLLGDEFNADIDRATIDVDGFWASLNGAAPWKVGFYGHNGPVENGVVHGESVLDDGIFGSAISDLKKNQLGVKVAIEDQEFKFVLTKSGYLELYQPRSIESGDFAEFVSNRVIPYVS